MNFNSKWRFKMKTFIVHMREVHSVPVRVEAEDEAEAIEKVQDGEGDYLDIHNYDSYIETAHSATWTVEEE
jgi:hypothetical protein